MKSLFTRFIAIGFATTVTATTASAETILLDFGLDPAAVWGSGTGYNFNSTVVVADGLTWNTGMWVDSSNSDARKFDRTNVLDITGASTDIDVTYVSGSLSSSRNISNVDTGATPPPTLQSGFGLLNNGIVANDYLWGSTPLVFTLSGLDSGSTYDLTIYGARASGTRSTNYQALGSTLFSENQRNGVSSATSGTVQLTNGYDVGDVNDFLELTVFSGISPDINNEITITATGLNTYYYLNAMQIVSVPEPSSMLLIGLGSLLMARIRRYA